MAPKSCPAIISEVDEMAKRSPLKESAPMKIIWKRVLVYVYFHVAALYGVYLMFTSAKWQTNAFAFLLYLLGGLGITAGVHRLWSHRSYKAKFPLRLFLAFLNTIAFQKDIYNWSRDHRVHHKYSETNADPHNAQRGFFFSHVGWVLCEKHPDVVEKGRSIDLSDLLKDPIVKFQRKYYFPLSMLCCFILPTVIPVYFWGETFRNAYFVPTILRYVFSLNQTFLVNSAAHMWGQRPYDVRINPADNFLVTLGVLGEGFHNYHHTFPFDYATSEYGIKWSLTTAFVDFMAFIGQAYDLKTTSKEIIAARKRKTGEDSPLSRKID